MPRLALQAKPQQDPSRLAERCQHVRGSGSNEASTAIIERTTLSDLPAKLTNTISAIVGKHDNAHQPWRNGLTQSVALLSESA